jgi:hypothetical protein
MKYLIVYGDIFTIKANEDFDVVHISMVNHENLIGRRYLDVFNSIDCFPTDEQWIELRACLYKD